MTEQLLQMPWTYAVAGIATLPLITVSNKTILRRLFLLLCASLFSYALASNSESFILAMCAAVFLSLTEETNGKRLQLSLVQVIILATGQWGNADVPEFILLALLSSIFLRANKFHGRSSLAIFWCVTLLMLVLAKSGIAATNATELPFLAILSLTVMGVLWFEPRRFGANEAAAQLILLFLVRKIVEARLTLLDFAAINVVSLIVQIGFNATLVYIMLGRHEEKSSYARFCSLLALASFLPLVPDLAQVKVAQVPSLYLISLGGIILMSKVKKQTHRADGVLYYLLGMIAWVALAIPMAFLVQSSQSILAWILVSACQLYTLIIGGGTDSGPKNEHWSRERLPQWGFLSLVFGGLLTLWYILHYVREIQG